MTDPGAPYQCFLGIDVSKRTLDVCLLQPSSSNRSGGSERPADQKHSREVSNDEEGFGALVRWLGKRQASAERTVVCLENTGLYDDRLPWGALTLAGYRCAVENTTVLKKVRPEHHRKGDGFDAALLAEYAYRFGDKLRLWKASKPVIEEIRLLYRERRRLLTHRAAAVQLRDEAPRRTAETRFAEQLWQEQLAFFDGQLDRLDEKLGELVRSDEDVFQRYRLVKSIPGFGPVASLLWTMLFYGEQRLCARQIASRFGFAPHARHSGTSQRAPARSSGHGKSEVRKVLTLCARSAGTHDEKLSAYKKKKLAEGKPSKLVTNNMINKLIRVASTLWNQGVHYDPDHVSRFVQKTALST